MSAHESVKGPADPDSPSRLEHGISVVIRHVLPASLFAVGCMALLCRRARSNSNLSSPRQTSKLDISK